jgi:hypothetical protein
VAAAEAATEKVIAELSTDFLGQGSALVESKKLKYKSKIPHAHEHAQWGKYRFKAGKGKSDETDIQQLTGWVLSPLTGRYAGMSGYASTFRVTAYAEDVASQRYVEGGVQQDVQLALIPAFQFALFYNMDMEIHPGANMTIRGRVHSNGNIYSEAQAHLTFAGDVSAVGQIVRGKKPDDPLHRNPGQVSFAGQHEGGARSLNLATGTDNSPGAVRQIVELPPLNESPTSQMGQHRLYNRADLVILVYDNKVEASSSGGKGPSLAWSTVSQFVRTNKTFYNKREGKTVKAVELDIAQLVAWNNTQNSFKNALGRDVSSIYIADLRSQSSSTEPGVRVVNGQALPPLGLTVATPDPLYVQGHFNAPDAVLGTDNTSGSKPAAFIADAITVLSGAWNDSKSTASLDSRPAGHTTVNAAFMSGIVPTTAGSYSGGVENFPRFLENWSGKTFTYNGSMIAMYESQIATAPWRGTGSTFGIYNPPVRNWNFDQNFTDPTKLPPLAPTVSAVLRGQWTTLTGTESAAEKIKESKKVKG